MLKIFFRNCFFGRFFLLPLFIGFFWLVFNSGFLNLVLADDSLPEEELIEEEVSSENNKGDQLMDNQKGEVLNDKNNEKEEDKKDLEIKKELDKDIDLTIDSEEIKREELLDEDFSEKYSTLEEIENKEKAEDTIVIKNEGQIFINEVAWMGSSFSSYDEWLELYNPNDFDLNLKDWNLNFWKPLKNEKGEIIDFDKDIYGKPYFSISFKEELIISAGKFLILAKEKYNQKIKDKVDFFYKGTLVNEGGYLELNNTKSEKVDFLNSLTGWQAGDNIQKLTLEKDDDQESWHTASIKNGTPRERNSLPQKETIEEENIFCEDYLTGVYLNEILPNPQGADQGYEWVEIFNENEFEINLSNWWLVNSLGKKFFLENVFLEAGEFKKINFSTTFVIKNQKEKITLFSCQGINRSELFFNEAAPSGKSFNRNKDGVWRWSGYLTPARENIFNQIPNVKIKKIKETFVNLPILFNASESWDGDDDELKFIWDFGDGKKSYLNKVSHTFFSVGKKKVLLKVNDGSEIVEKIINLEIKKYPQRKVSLVKILPNPKGKDSGKELIWIKNLNNKKVNLKNWKIFTGSSEEKSVGHLISNDFFLKKDEEKSLSQKESLFSLTNQNGYVALYYPDGEKAFELTYNSEKVIPEGAFYFLDQNDQWQWNFPLEEKISLVEDETENVFEEDESILETEVLGKENEFSWDDFFEKLGKKKTLSWREIEFFSWQKKNSVWLEFLK